MVTSRFRIALAAGTAAVVFATSAPAIIPVIDIRAIFQMVQQLSAMQAQLTTLQSHLAQARSAYQAITGGRGMENLLAGTARNYLPSDWQAMTDMVRGASAQYSALSNSLNQIVARNAYLTNAQLAALTPAARSQLEEQRRSVATLQTVAEEALSNTSGRFEALQQLIDAIPSATDEKGVLDLQARIGAEQGMLANEQTKLNLMLQAAQAAELARQQRNRERAVEGLGSLRALPPMGL
jgi:type IV secretion system protein VirB5